MDKPVSSIMQKIVLPVAMDDTVDEVETMLKSHRISCAPVYSADDGKLIGILTTGDLARVHASGRDPGQIKAWEICSYHPVEVTPETPIAKVAELMLEHRIHHVVVMQGGSMGGIVSSLDFVKLALDHGN